MDNIKRAVAEVVQTWIDGQEFAKRVSDDLASDSEIAVETNPLSDLQTTIRVKATSAEYKDQPARYFTIVVKENL
jgi:hypothetical protein